MDDSNIYSLVPYFKDNYEVITIFVLLCIEVLLRKIPSYKDNSIINRVLFIFDKVVSNNIIKKKTKKKDV